MNFEGVLNFRDLGGYRGAGGLVVRTGRLFRADDLSRLTAADQTLFTALGIRTVIDLRRPNEVAEVGRIPAFDGFAYHNLHLVHPPWQQRPHPDTADRIAFLDERYREMSSEGGEAIGAALRLIANAESAPLVFHCLAGKDRTGLIAALALGLLGVDDDTIADDYHRSDLAEDKSWARYAREHDISEPNPRSHIEVSPRATMHNFLDGLRTRYGSLEAYAARHGVTSAHIEAMRSHLLANSPAEATVNRPRTPNRHDHYPSGTRPDR